MINELQSNTMYLWLQMMAAPETDTECWEYVIGM